jgi:hypothetical protein
MERETTPDGVLCHVGRCTGATGSGRIGKPAKTHSGGNP